MSFTENIKGVWPWHLKPPVWDDRKTQLSVGWRETANFEELLYEHEKQIGKIGPGVWLCLSSFELRDIDCDMHTRNKCNDQDEHVTGVYGSHLASNWNICRILDACRPIWMVEDFNHCR